MVKLLKNNISMKFLEILKKKKNKVILEKTGNLQETPFFHDEGRTDNVTPVYPTANFV